MAIAVITNGAESSLGAASFTTAPFDTSGATLIAVAFDWNPAAIPPGFLMPTLSDSNNNLWRTLSIQTTHNISTVLAFALNPTVGTGHTFALDNLYPFLGSIKILALSGVSIHLPFDKENGAIDGAHGSGDGFNTGSVTPSTDNQIVITTVSVLDASGGTLSVGSSFTKSDEVAYSDGINFGSALAYKIQTTAAAVNPKWTIDTPSGWSWAAACIATFATAPIPLPTPVLPVPEDTGSLAIYDAEQFAVQFYLANMTVEKMVNPVFTQMKSGNIPVAGAVAGQTLLQTIASLKATLGVDCLIGTYISPIVLDDISDTADGYEAQDPKARIPGPGLGGTVFDESECLSYTSGPATGQLIRPYNVDFMQSSARAKMLSAIDDELLSRQDYYSMQMIETDNWIFDEISSPEFPYPIGKADVLDWFDDVHDLIHSRGYLHQPNFGFWASGLACSDADILRVASKADMVWYEGGAKTSYLSNEANITEWLRRGQLVIDAGCRILLDATTTDTPPLGAFPEGYNNDASLLAGLAMYMGPSFQFLAYPYFLPRATWFWLEWPGAYGAPTAAGVQIGTNLSRQFGLNRLEIDMLNRNVVWRGPDTVTSSNKGVRGTAALLGS